MLNRILPCALIACAPTFAQSPNASASPEAAIQAADRDWARVFAAKDLDQSVNACAETASVLAPNAPKASGRAAIRQVFAGLFALPDLAVAWAPSEARVARSGELGYTSGAYQMSFKAPDGKTVSDHGKYATVWEKQKDGGWKVVLDIFNSDLPTP